MSEHSLSKDQIDLLMKFMPRIHGGTAIRTMDEDFGLPETYLVTILYNQREIIEQALRLFFKDQNDTKLEREMDKRD